MSNSEARQCRRREQEFERSTGETLGSQSGVTDPKALAGYQLARHNNFQWMYRSG